MEFLIPYDNNEPARSSTRHVGATDFPTIRSLLDFTEMNLTSDALKRSCDLPSYALIDPVEKTMSAIVDRYRWICTVGPDVPFHLSAHLLADLVEKIDKAPRQLGFYYQEVLMRETSFIVSRPICEEAGVEQIVQPIQIWRVNLHHFQCWRLGGALLLFLMHRFVRQEKRFTHADWSPLIYIVKHAPIDQLPLLVNRAGVYIRKNLKEEES